MNTYNRSNMQTSASLRQLIRDYNTNIRLNSEVMLEYNRNIRTMIDMLSRPQQPQRSELSNLEFLLNNVFPQPTSSVQGLTLAELEDSTELLTYDSEDVEESRCPISLDEFRAGEILCRIKHCGHTFKRAPLITWFQTHITCPSCRHNLRSGSVPPNSEDDSSEQTNFSRILTSLITDISGNSQSREFVFQIPFDFSSV